MPLRRRALAAAIAFLLPAAAMADAADRLEDLMRRNAGESPAQIAVTLEKCQLDIRVDTPVTNALTGDAPGRSLLLLRADLAGLELPKAKGRPGRGGKGIMLIVPRRPLDNRGRAIAARFYEMVTASMPADKPKGTLEALYEGLDKPGGRFVANLPLVHRETEDGSRRPEPHADAPRFHDSLTRVVEAEAPMSAMLQGVWRGDGAPRRENLMLGAMAHGDPLVLTFASEKDAEAAVKALAEHARKNCIPALY